MATMRSHLALALVFLGNVLGAQVLPAPQPSLFWRLNDLVVVQDGLSNTQARGTGKARSLGIPSGFSHVHATDDGFWANRTQGRNRNRDCQVLFSPDGVHWHLQATWPLRGQAPGCRLFALRDRFLGVATTAPFVQGESTSHFAVLKAGKGSLLVVDSLLPMELGNHHPDWIFLPTLVQIPDGWALVNSRTGHVWLVTDRGESVRIRKAKLYASVKDEAIEQLGCVDPPILGCQPTMDGSLLIAARSEEAVLQAAVLREKASQAQGDAPPRIDLGGIDLSDTASQPRLEAQLAALEERLRERREVVEGPILARFPEVVWWRLDPATGLFTRAEAPPGAPEALPTLERLQRFAFRFDVKGRYIQAD